MEGLIVPRPDQVWVSDITYIRLMTGLCLSGGGHGCVTRAIRGWNLSRYLDASWSLEALEIALQAYTPEIHHSDQGIQYAASEYVRELLRRKSSDPD